MMALASGSRLLILLCLLVSCSKEYSCEGCYTPPITEKHYGMGNTLSFTGDNLQWFTYNIANDSLLWTAGQPENQIADIRFLFSDTTYFKLYYIPENYHGALRVEYYRVYPPDKPDDLLKIVPAADTTTHLYFEKNAGTILFTAP